MPWRIRYNNFINIAFGLSPHIIQHADSSWNGINFGLSEPLIVREYLHSPIYGLSYLNQHVSPLLTQAGYEVKFAGIFVHQKPRITRPHATNNRQCELGDLLVIFTFLDATKRPLVNRAFLIQAKKHLPMTNVCQRELYDHETEFDMPAAIYNQSRCSRSPLRRFPPYTNQRWQALKYMFCPSTPVNVLYSPSASGISSSFGIPILGIITGFDGLKFSRQPYPGNSWSAIIWDLIDVVAPALIGSTSIARGSNLQHLVSLFNDFHNRDKYFREEHNSEGLPIMLVIVRDRESFVA
jgi:hypothetical protein